MKNFIKSKVSTFILAALSAAALSLGACATAPSSKQGKADIQAEAAATLSKAKTKDASLDKQLKNAAGYAVFPSIGKGAIGIGGAYGQGVVYQDGSVIGFTSVSQATIGFQLGGQAYSQIIVFATPKALKNFTDGNLEFSAQATAVALKSGAGANAKYKSGVAVFTLGEEGLMYEASIGGQKFSYQAKTH